jgi:hypothetical protein
MTRGRFKIVLTKPAPVKVQPARAAYCDNVILTPGAKAILNGEAGAILNLAAQKTESLTPNVGVRLEVGCGDRI